MNFLTCIFRLGFELLGKLHLESMVVCETFSLFGEITYHLIFGTNFLALISVLQSKLYDVTWILYCDWSNHSPLNDKDEFREYLMACNSKQLLVVKSNSDRWRAWLVR